MTLLKSNKLFFNSIYNSNNKFKNIWVSLNTLLNLRGHLGDSVSSTLTRSSVLGKRHDQTVFDVGYSLLSLKRALYFVRYVLNSNLLVNESPKYLLIVVQNQQLASRLVSHFNLLEPGNSSNIKLVSNWVSGSLTPNDNVLNRSLSTEDDSANFFLSNPDRRPGFVLVLGNFSEMRSVALEANYARVANAAVVSSNSSGYEVTFPISGNDNSIDFLFYVGSLFIKCALTFNKI